MSKEFWVFGYGSLMWRPGFVYQERCVAELADHQRNFCLDSVRYRGTPERPGLVLALEPKKGACCRGIAYRVSESEAAETYEYLTNRELVTQSYHEMTLPLLLEDGRKVKSICYVIDQTHEQYRNDLSADRKARIIAEATGPAGANSEYLFNTYKDLKEMSVTDAEVEDLVKRVCALIGSDGSELL